MTPKNTERNPSLLLTLFLIVTLITIPLEVNGENEETSNLVQPSTTVGIITPAPPAVRRHCNMFARKSCMCPMNFKPVCGSDGVTYANLCQFHCAQKCEPSLNFERCGRCWQNLTSSRTCLTT